MKKTFFALAALTAISTTSCNKNKCGGADTNIYNYGMEISNSAAEVRATNGVYNDALTVTPLSRSENGDRDCLTKDLVMNIKENVDDSNIIITCNREIKLADRIVAAGTNIHTAGKRFTTIKIEIPVSERKDNPYIYYLEGKTDKNNTFRDTIVVNYIP